MKLRFGWIAILMLLAPFGAAAMQQSAAPSKFNIPWGNSAGPTYIRTIPQASQIGTTNCAASLTDGFPPLSFTPVGSGGCPPFGQDFNGILRQITQWIQWQTAGGPVFWDSAFNASIGGYPKGAILQSAVLTGRLWYCTADNNTTNPDATDGSSANWIPLPGTQPPGEIMPMAFQANTNQGYVVANGQTIGNASSNATSRANADTFWLFSYLWGNCPGCTLFNSSGSVVSKGATPGADFTANRAIAVYNINGIGLMGADSQAGTSSSFLNGVPVSTGSTTGVTSIIGENLHSQTISEMPSHNHGITDPGHGHSSNANQEPTAGTLTGGSGFGVGVVPFQGLATINNNTTGISINFNGSGNAFNDVQRSFIVYWFLKL